MWVFNSDFFSRNCDFFFSHNSGFFHPCNSGFFPQNWEIWTHNCDLWSPILRGKKRDHFLTVASLYLTILRKSQWPFFNSVAKMGFHIKPGWMRSKHRLTEWLFLWMTSRRASVCPARVWWRSVAGNLYHHSLLRFLTPALDKKTNAFEKAFKCVHLLYRMHCHIAFSDLQCF